jgi:hypothetical protein
MLELFPAMSLRINSFKRIAFFGVLLIRGVNFELKEVSAAAATHVERNLVTHFIKTT